MMGIEKLIDDYRKAADKWEKRHPVTDTFDLRVQDALRDAATALSTLQAENEKLREKIEDARLEGYIKGLGEMSEENERLWAELERVKRERDAIEQDFRAFTKQWWEEDSGFPCRWCKFENSGGCEWKAKQPNEEKICAGRAFEWRG